MITFTELRFTYILYLRTGQQFSYFSRTLNLEPEEQNLINITLL